MQASTTKRGYNMDSILVSAATAYVVLFIIKLALAGSSLPLAISAVSIKETGRRWSWFWAITITASSVLYLAVMILPLLCTEGMRFFVAYRNIAVMRDVLRVYRG